MGLSKDESLASWRMRGKIVEVGQDYQKLLALLGDHMDRLDASNVVILIQRLAQVSSISK